MVERLVAVALVLAVLAGAAWAAAQPGLSMRFEVVGLRMVLPVLPEQGARPPAQFFARSATGTMDGTVELYAQDVTGRTRLQLQDQAAQDAILKSPLALMGQPEGTLRFPQGVQVQWSSGELTAASAVARGSLVDMQLPVLHSEKMLMRADTGVLRVRSTGAADAAPMDATFSGHVQVRLR